MNVRRTTAVVATLFVVAVAVWLSLRQSVSSPGRNAAATDGVGGSQTTVDAVGPTTSSPAVAAGSPSGTAGAPGAHSPLPPTPAAIPAAQILPIPVVSNAAAAQPDAGSTNAIKVRRMVTDYHTLYGENPVGTNAEIMAAVMGKNSRQAVLGPPDGIGLNSKGELIDEWGTPYFFHQLSKDTMEIHSAGPDKVMGTADDIVVH